MNNSSDLENLKDDRAERREQKKKPRMKKHGAGLKKPSTRGVERIHKLKRKS